MKIEAGHIGTRWKAWCADESGATRMDRLIPMIGLAALTLLLVVSMMEGEDAPAVAGGEGAPSAAAPERRVVSSGGWAATEPQRQPGVEIGAAHVSPGYMDRFEERYDNELAILMAQTEAAIAAEEAARAAEEAAAPAEPDPAAAAPAADGS
jgi:hypothetical protein